jgi:hypothetical protein
MPPAPNSDLFTSTSSVCLNGIRSLRFSVTTRPCRLFIDDQKWIVENWLLRAKAAGLKTAASKIPTRHFGKIAVASVQLFATPGILIRAFYKIEDA